MGLVLQRCGQLLWVVWTSVVAKVLKVVLVKLFLPDCCLTLKKQHAEPALVACCQGKVLIQQVAGETVLLRLSPSYEQVPVRQRWKRVLVPQHQQDVLGSEPRLDHWALFELLQLALRFAQPHVL